jgi:hypothetical protein
MTTTTVCTSVGRRALVCKRQFLGVSGNVHRCGKREITLPWRAPRGGHRRGRDLIEPDEFNAEGYFEERGVVTMNDALLNDVG